MSTEPDSLILQLLRQMRAELGTVRTEVEAIRSDMATKNDLADVRSEIQSLRADVASDLLVARKETSDQIVGLRRAVVEYHSSVIGHGNISNCLNSMRIDAEQRADRQGPRAGR